MFLSYDELEVVVKNVAKSFSRSFYNMEREDLEQELRILMWEKKPESSNWAAAQCRNYCKDLLRKAHRHDAVILNGGMSDEDGERESYNQRIDHPYSDNGYARSELVEKIRREENERVRRYAIAKAYLDCDIVELEDEFFKMFNELDNEKKKQIKNSNKITDSLIIKTFLGINSCSSAVCVLKQNVRDNIFNDVPESNKEAVRKILKKRAKVNDAKKKFEDEEKLNCLEGLSTFIDSVLTDLGYNVNLIKKLNKEGE